MSVHGAGREPAQEPMPCFALLVATFRPAVDSKILNSIDNPLAEAFSCTLPFSAVTAAQAKEAAKIREGCKETVRQLGKPQCALDAGDNGIRKKGRNDRNKVRP